jgi:hypothetical protein
VKVLQFHLSALRTLAGQWKAQPVSWTNRLALDTYRHSYEHWDCNVTSSKRSKRKEDSVI